MFAALGGQAVVFPGRAGVRLLPFVVEQALAAHLAQERVERALLRGEFRAGELLQDVGGIDLLRRNDLQQQELKETLADGGEFFVETHAGLINATFTRQGSVGSQGVKRIIQTWRAVTVTRGKTSSISLRAKCD